jgi:hypothetical protein
MRTISFSLLVLLLPFVAWGQDFPDFPQKRPHTRWQMIDTEHFRVVFPAEIEPMGQEVANTLEHVRPALSATAGAEPPRDLEVFLRNETTYWNAMALLNPKRSDWFTAKQQYNFWGNVAWAPLYAIHEMRHAAQYQNANVGLVRALQVPLGGFGGLTQFLAYPHWYLEGDATAMETLLTDGGRGRTTWFLAVIRAQALSDATFPYDKSYLGSMRDYVPDDYTSGYLLATWLRAQHDPDVLARASRRAAAFWLIPFPFSFHLRILTGHGLRKTWRDAVGDARTTWEAQLEDLGAVDYPVLAHRPPGAYFDDHPQDAGSEGAIVFRRGAGYPGTFVLIRPTGEEKVLRVSGPGEHSKAWPRWDAIDYSAAAGRFVWAEYRYHPRWPGTRFSVIRRYDLDTGRTRTLTHRSRLLRPALSHDGLRVVAVEQASDLTVTVVVLDAETGEELERHASPDNDWLFSPSWSRDGRKVVLVRQRSDGFTAVTELDLESGAFQNLRPFNGEAYDEPLLHDGYVVYESGYSGIGNLYAADLDSGEVFQVTNSRFGVYAPSVSQDGSRLLFSQVSPTGYDAAELPWDPTSWVSIAEVPVRPDMLYAPLLEQEGEGVHVLDDVPEEVYEVRPYRYGLRLFNVHQWMPVFPPLEPDVGITFRSTDRMYLARADIGYRYNLHERTHRAFLDATYLGLWPALDFGGSYGGRAGKFEVEEDTLEWDSWKERSVYAGPRLPLNLSVGKWAQDLSVAAYFDFVDISGLELGPEEHAQGNGTLLALSYHLDASREQRRSQRDFRPRWGQHLSVDYHHTPLGGDYDASLLALWGGVYLPGPFRHHTLHLAGGYDLHDGDGYRFKDPLPFARGYAWEPMDERVFATAEYAFPLGYPDLALGPLFYFQRVKATLFYDLTTGTQLGDRITSQSAGLEITTDVCILRFMYPFDLGVRVAWAVEDQRPIFAPMVVALPF